MSKLAKAVVMEALLVGVCALSGLTKSLKKGLVECWEDPRKRLWLAGWLGTFVFLAGCEHTPETLDDALNRLRADLFQGTPPLTTSLVDAFPEFPAMDGFTPKDWRPMNVLPRGKDGSFLLIRPGAYWLEAKSYCLHAGTYAPSGGDGYLYAPLKGARAEIVSNVLRRAGAQPDLSQRDVQVLLWAILARTRLRYMPESVRVTANRLLTSSERFEIDGGALGLIPESLLDKAAASLPSVAREILRAETRLRELLTQGVASYDELEQVAVRFGSAPLGEGSLEVPRGRWSQHPDGFYVRLFPKGYKRTRIELYMPGDKDIGLGPSPPGASTLALAALHRVTWEPTSAGTSISKPASFEPSSGAAMPGNTSSQRLGLSASSSSESDPDCEQISLLKQQIEDKNKTKNLYNELQHEAENCDELDKKVLERLAEDCPTCPIEEGGYHDTGTGQIRCYDMCKRGYPRPACEWFNEGCRQHEKRHADDCKLFPSLCRSDKPKHCALRENDAYKEEIEYYNHLLRSLEKKCSE